MFKLFYNYILFLSEFEFCQTLLMQCFYNEPNANPPSKFELSLHGDGFQVVVTGGARLHLLFKTEAVVRLVAKVEVRFIVLRGIHNDHALLGERNVDVKHADCETDDECRP